MKEGRGRTGEAAVKDGLLRGRLIGVVDRREVRKLGWQRDSDPSTRGGRPEGGVRTAGWKRVRCL